MEDGIGFLQRWPPATVIKSREEWEEVKDPFIESIGDLGIIGLDCEWVDAVNFEEKEEHSKKHVVGLTILDSLTDSIRIANASSGKVALLQLAAYEGMVLLIRLCFFTEMPPSLKALLEDGDVIKLGVNIETDAKKLFMDWSVITNGFVDMRNVVVRIPRFLDEYHKRGLGLKKLGGFLTGYDRFELMDMSVRYSHWAAPELSLDQIAYARNDAIAAIEGVFCFATKYIDGIPDPSDDRSRFAKVLRNVLLIDANRTCPDHVTHILSQRKDAGSCEEPPSAASKKAEERRQRRQAKMEIEEQYSSEIELNYAGWTKSTLSKSVQMREGLQRAVVFTNDQNENLAAIDSLVLEAMKETNEMTKVFFDVKNTRGDTIYEVQMDLKKIQD